MKRYPSQGQSLLTKPVPRLRHCLGGANTDLPARVSVGELDRVCSPVACCMLPRGCCFSLGEDGDLLPLPVGNGARAAGVPPAPPAAQHGWRQKRCGWGGLAASEGNASHPNQPPAAMDLDLPYAASGVEQPRRYPGVEYHTKGICTDEAQEAPCAAC